jgi:hypothetical protein
MERRLAGWNRFYLSKGCRITLIKNALSNLPAYCLSFFLILVDVANSIEKLQRDFLWGRVGEEFKFHIVSWSKICTMISSGGLGVRNVLMFNRGLLGNGYGIIPQRGRFCGDQLWKLNMIACGEGGVPMRFLGPTGLGCGKTLGEGEGFALDW